MLSSATRTLSLSQPLSRHLTVHCRMVTVFYRRGTTTPFLARKNLLHIFAQPSAATLSPPLLSSSLWRAVSFRGVHGASPAHDSPSSKDLRLRYMLVFGTVMATSSTWIAWHMISGEEEEASDVVTVRDDHGKCVFKEPSMKERLHFAIDDFLSTTAYPRLAILGTTTGLLLVFGSASFYYLSGVKLSVREALWKAWTTIVDPGTHTIIQAGQGRMRPVSVVFTLGGLIFFALLIGLVSDSVGAKFEELQAGRSQVLVRDHALMLGWSQKIESMLTVAGRDFDSSTARTYVVLAEKQIGDVKLENKARVIFREGDPSIVHNLVKVSPNTARSIIIFSPEIADDDEADAWVMARIMALVSLGVKVPIVVEIRDKDNLAVIHKMLHTSGTLSLNNDYAVVPLAGSDIVGKILVEGALQPGFAKVVHHLLDYQTAQENEIYMQSIDKLPQIEGQPYGEVVFMLRGCVLLGVMADRLKGDKRCAPHSCLLLNPPNDFVLRKGDKLCAVARNATSFGPSRAPASHSGNPVSSQPEPQQHPRKNLIIFHWRDDMEDIFQEIDKRVGKGSVVSVISEFSKEHRDELLEKGGGLGKLKNIRIQHIQGQTVKPAFVEQTLSNKEFDAVMVLSNDIEDGSLSADARSIICSFLVESHLRETGKNKAIKNVHPYLKINDLDSMTMTEIKNRSSLQLLRIARVANFVIANELAAMMMVQLAYTPELRHFWIDEICSDHGNDLDIVRVGFYVNCSHADKVANMTFWDLVATCRVQEATPIAVQRKSDDTFIFNPPDKCAPLKLHEDDLVVVVARRF